MPTSPILPMFSFKSPTYKVRVADVVMGGDAPVVVQSMTNTDTADVYGTVAQIAELAHAGSEIVRVTVNNLEAARAVPKIRELLLAQNLHIPLVGCFHYNGHTLLQEVEECAVALDKYRINPGNVGFGDKRDKQFAMMIEMAIKHNKPVRIGVNWGSLDQELLARCMDDNQQLSAPKTLPEVMRYALVQSALESAALAESIGLPSDKIIISCKASDPKELVLIYQDLAARCQYPLHLGLTEAGMGVRGIVNSTIALSDLLKQGIGNTIRVSLTPKVGEPRTKEVEVCKEILQGLGLRSFAPQITACPGCGRTTSDYFQRLAEDIQLYIDENLHAWAKINPRVKELKIAVMGCIVNGPGESKHADIGISLPGTNESPSAPVFIDGKKAMTLRGDDIAAQFKAILAEYVAKRF